VDALLRVWGLGGIAEDACLIASELVTNAFLSTRAERRSDPIRLWVLGSERTVLLLVWDSSTPAPVLSVPSDEAENGRGLMIVEALSREWGSYQADGGKVVWSALTQSGPTARRVSLYPLLKRARTRDRPAASLYTLARVKAALQRMPPAGGDRR
jgi:hypothetical protein